MGLPYDDQSGGVDKATRQSIVELSKRLIIEHRTCNIGSLVHCDLYYDIIESVIAIVEDAVEKERSLMLCHHPRAALRVNGNGHESCGGCVNEAKIRREALAFRNPAEMNGKM